MPVAASWATPSGGRPIPEGVAEQQRLRVAGDAGAHGGQVAQPAAHGGPARRRAPSERGAVTGPAAAGRPARARRSRRRRRPRPTAFASNGMAAFAALAALRRPPGLARTAGPMATAPTESGSATPKARSASTAAPTASTSTGSASSAALEGVDGLRQRRDHGGQAGGQGRVVDGTGRRVCGVVVGPGERRRRDRVAPGHDPAAPPPARPARRWPAGHPATTGRRRPVTRRCRHRPRGRATRPGAGRRGRRVQRQPVPVSRTGLRQRRTPRRGPTARPRRASSGCRRRRRARRRRGRAEPLLRPCGQPRLGLRPRGRRPSQPPAPGGGVVEQHEHPMGHRGGPGRGADHLGLDRRPRRRRRPRPWPPPARAVLPCTSWCTDFGQQHVRDGVVGVGGLVEDAVDRRLVGRARHRPGAGAAGRGCRPEAVASAAQIAPAAGPAARTPSTTLLAAIASWASSGSASARSVSRPAETGASDRSDSVKTVQAVLVQAPLDQVAEQRARAAGPGGRRRASSSAGADPGAGQVDGQRSAAGVVRVVGQVPAAQDARRWPRGSGSARARSRRDAWSATPGARLSTQP